MNTLLEYWMHLSCGLLGVMICYLVRRYQNHSTQSKALYLEKSVALMLQQNPESTLHEAQIQWERLLFKVKAFDDQMFYSPLRAIKQQKNTAHIIEKELAGIIHILEQTKAHCHDAQVLGQLQLQQQHFTRLNRLFQQILALETSIIANPKKAATLKEYLTLVKVHRKRLWKNSFNPLQMKPTKAELLPHPNHKHINHYVTALTLLVSGLKTPTGSF